MSTTLALLTKEFRTRWLSLTILSLAGFGFALMYIAMFPSIQSQADQLSQLTAAMGDALKAIGIQDLGFSTLEGFISIEYFTIVWPILAFALISSWAGGMLAGEIETGTMGRLLSLPLGRQRIFWSKYATALLGLIIFSTISILACIPAAAAYDISFNAYHFWLTYALCMLFGWAFLSLGMLVSAAVSERSKVVMAVCGLAILMYVATAAAGLKDSLAWLKHLSFFSYLDVQNLLVKGQWQWETIVIFVVFSLICSIAAAIIFQKRDIAV